MYSLYLVRYIRNEARCFGTIHTTDYPRILNRGAATVTASSRSGNTITATTTTTTCRTADIVLINVYYPRKLFTLVQPYIRNMLRYKICKLKDTQHKRCMLIDDNRYRNVLMVRVTVTFNLRSRCFFT